MSQNINWQLAAKTIANSPKGHSKAVVVGSHTNVLNWQLITFLDDAKEQSLVYRIAVCFTLLSVSSCLVWSSRLLMPTEIVTLFWT